MKTNSIITPALMEEMAKTIVQSEAYQRKLASAKASYERDKMLSSLKNSEAASRKLASAKAAYERDKESLKKMLPKRG